MGQTGFNGLEMQAGMCSNVLLDAVCDRAASDLTAAAFRSSHDNITTYGDLWSAACRIAHGLAERVTGTGPVLVLGPKSALTVECFLACLMSGHAYVPIDVELPARRVADIAGQIEDATMLSACEVPAGFAQVMPGAGVIDADALLGEKDAAEDGGACEPLPRSMWVSGEKTQYIIFTSGSTGRPKGIEVTAANVANFRRWLAGFPVVRDGGRVFLDQAHYSFDLSEYELVGALTTGGCLHAVDAAKGADFKALFASLATSGVEVWVSTPSFADLCLVDPSFNADLLPNVKLFLFCGETLHHTTVQKLRDRFGAGVIFANTYGPTESTVAVTYCEIGKAELADPQPLPVGYPRVGTNLRICDRETGAELPRGQTGEIVIVGDTVAAGYYANPAKTAESFFSATMRDGIPARGYKTGDLGFIDEKGMLRCVGRADSLVKLNGYRIELGEVEGAIEEIGCVRHAVVVPVTRAGRVTSLCAFVVADAAAGQTGFSLGRELKEALGRTLPAYMVPRQVRVIDAMPLNANGKADRKALAASVSR